jgi:hypothetical protein
MFQALICLSSGGTVYTGYTKKNGVISKVNKECISQLARAQRAPSAAAAV